MGGLFEIDDILGSGAFAVVCKARDVTRPDDPPVALKVLTPDLMADAHVLDRMRDEGRMLSQLEHPHIIGVHRLLDYDGRPVIEMELVEGVPLDQLLRERPRRDGLPARVALRIGSAVAKALDAAYNGAFGEGGEPMNIIHRDVKPCNILLAVDGGVKVTDFGIAKGQFKGREAKSLYTVAGTAGYIAPERKNKQPETQKVDVYALGVTLFELLSDKRLLATFKRGAHDDDIERQLMHLHPDGLRDPSDIRDLLGAMLREDPDERPDMTEVAARLETLVAGVGLASDLTSHARRYVRPMIERRKRDRILPRDHPAWRGIAFLEERPPTPPKARLDKRQGQQQLRRFLRTDGWETRTVELRQLLERCTDFPTQPFLELLDRAEVPGWKFWSRPATPPQIEAALMALCDHADDDVLARVRPLVEHGDTKVATAARFLLSQSG